jgi:hypothetical protein
MRVYSAHNCLHVNAPATYRFAHSYITARNCFGASPFQREATNFVRIDRAFRKSDPEPLNVCHNGPSRTRPLSRSVTYEPSRNTRHEFRKRGIEGESNTQFVPGTRAYSAHNCFQVNATASHRFVRSYTIVSSCFWICTNDGTTFAQVLLRKAWGGRRGCGAIAAE